MEKGDYPDLEYAKSVCKIGHGAECCRYLTMGTSGWSCEKHSELKTEIDARVAHYKFNARGDNCEGKKSR